MKHCIQEEIIDNVRKSQWKERLLFEYHDIVEKRTKLEAFLKTNNVDNETLELLERQLNVMFQYEEILFKRIIKLIKGGE